MDSQKLSDLLKKYEQGKCSADELKLLNTAYNQWSENEKLPSIDQTLGAKQQQQWRKLQSTIRPQPRFRIQHAAAVLIIGIFIFSVYTLIRNYSPEHYGRDLHTAQTSHIVHDNGSALLTKEDGTQVSLATDQEIQDILISTITDIRPITVHTPKGSSFEFTLPDGSQVLLNPSSKITFPSRFDSDIRQVEAEGEIYFNIKSITDEPNLPPFEAHSAGQIIRVLGTRFTIHNYQGNNSSFAILEEGKISITNTLAPQAPVETLHPGQKALITSQGTTISEVDLELSLAWKNGDFAFSDQNLEQLASQISLWYDVEFNWVNPARKNEKFEGLIPRNRSIAEVLGAIEATGKVKFRLKDRLISVL